MENGEIGAHMVAAVKIVEEGCIHDIDNAIAQVRRMEDAVALDLLPRIRLVTPMDVQVWTQ